MSIEEISEDPPELQKEDFLGVFEFAKLAISGNSIREVV